VIADEAEREGKAVDEVEKHVRALTGKSGEFKEIKEMEARTI